MKAKNTFNDIISLENLFFAWDEFKTGKQSKPDVMQFELEVEKEVFKLAFELRNKTYEHEPYSGFFITDPKLRHIHKATVRDRVVHHAVYNILTPIFEPTFISHSFSCRIGKGVHKGVEAVANALRKVSKNNTKHCYALKCDIRKFFDSVDHEILLSILTKRIKDPNTVWMMEKLIRSYSFGGTERERERERERESLALRADNIPKRGVPIGNLTSQLFANIYMNEFDQFVKHELKVKHYARYTDDFIVVSESKEYLENLLPLLSKFLDSELKLSIHPNKIDIRKHHQGVDFLGYVIFPHHRLVRKRTVKRMYHKLRGKVKEFKNGTISKETLQQTVKSYEGILSHANAHHLLRNLLNEIWIW